MTQDSSRLRLGVLGMVVLYALVGSMLGERMIAGHLITIAAVVGLSNAVLAPVAVKFVDWSLGSLKTSPSLSS